MAAASSTRAKPPAKPGRTVLVVFNDGTTRTVGNIPATAKITFGPLTPGKGYDNPTSLRIYTAANNQLAVFVGVREFRDLSLEVQTEYVDVHEQQLVKDGPDGRRTERVYETKRHFGPKESF